MGSDLAAQLLSHQTNSHFGSYFLIISRMTASKKISSHNNGGVGVGLNDCKKLSLFFLTHMVKQISVFLTTQLVDTIQLLEVNYKKEAPYRKPRSTKSSFAARRLLGRRRSRPDADPLLLVLDEHRTGRGNRVHLQEQGRRLVVLHQGLPGAELHQQQRRQADRCERAVEPLAVRGEAELDGDRKSVV